MRKLKPFEIFVYVFGLFPVLLFIMVVVGLPVGLMVGSGTFLEFGVFAGFATPIALIYWMINSRLKQVRKTWAESEAGVMESLNKVDYLNYGTGGAIALDTEKRLISLVDAFNAKKIKPAKVFGLDKLLNYRSHQPGRTEFYGQGSFNANSKEVTKHAMATGLYLEIDDINTPELFLRMEYEEASKWVFLLDKVRSGSLEPQGKPMFYPSID